MKQTFYILLIALFTCSSSLNTFAQENEKDQLVNLNTGADLMSRFVWRGMQLGGTSPCIQPNMSLGIGNFEIGVFGSYSIGGENQNQEFDLYTSYTFYKNLFTVSFTDYFSPAENRDYEYFDFDDETTGHIFEGSLSFNGTDNIPVTFLTAVIFYGADAITLNDNPGGPNFNTRSGIQYSNYFELGYNLELKDVSFSPFLGITLNNPADPVSSTGFIGETGFYGTGPGIINFGFSAIKDIKITDKFSIPLTVSLITNPQAEKVFLVVGFSF